MTIAYFRLATKFALKYFAAYPVKIGYIRLTTEQIVMTAENNVAILRTDPAYIQGLGTRNTKTLSLTYGVMKNALVPA